MFRPRKIEKPIDLVVFLASGRKNGCLSYGVKPIDLLIVYQDILMSVVS